MRPAAPTRLSNGPVGALIERANREFEGGVDESIAFRSLSVRLERRRRRSLLWLEFVAASLIAVALTVGLVVKLRRTRASAPVAELAAEPVRTLRPRSSADVARNVAPTGTLPSERRREARPASTAEQSVTKPRARVASAVDSEGEVAPRPSAAAPVTQDESAPDCLSFARNGATRVAEDCFLKRAEGSGIGAEMALYEVARLRRDVLADPAGALQALSDYRRRFPSGSLRREADMSQLELLVQLGRSNDALRQTEELLASSAAGERAAELHLLRGHIFRKNLGQWRAAEREYALAETASGASHIEASYFRGVCLQALGELAAARAAYERYLEQGGRNYGTEVRRRLESLP